MALTDGSFISFTDNVNDSCYFLISLGRNYIDECKLLGNTIRKQGDMKPIYLLIYEKDFEYAKTNGFDGAVKFDPSDQLWEDSVTSFEKYCLYPRILFDKYISEIPVKEIITVDSDVLCQWSVDKIWEYMRSRQLPIGMTGVRYDSKWHWGTIEEVSTAYGKHVPHVHGGFFYIRKDDEFITAFFEYCREIFYLYDNYKCKRMFRGGKVDEIIFAIAHSNFNIWPIEFGEYPIITFNYSADIKLPSNLQTENGDLRYMNDYIPFIHMFEKMHGYNFKSLYSQIMSR